VTLRVSRAGSVASIEIADVGARALRAPYQQSADLET
jgi:hypothetical protein